VVSSPGRSDEVVEQPPNHHYWEIVANVDQVPTETEAEAEAVASEPSNPYDRLGQVDPVPAQPPVYLQLTDGGDTVQQQDLSSTSPVCVPKRPLVMVPLPLPPCSDGGDPVPESV